MTATNPMTSSTTGTAGPDPMSPELIADPCGGYGKLREQAPVLRGQFMEGSPVWFVTRYEDVHTVLGDPRFVNDPASVPGPVAVDIRRNVMESMGVPPELGEYLSGGIIDSDAPDHTRLRKLVSRTFTVRRVADLRPRVEAITAALLDDLAAAAPGPVDLVETFAYPLPITVICELVGIPEADRPAWHDWGRALVSMNPKVLPDALRAMVDHIHDLIRRRRAEPADDLLSGLIRTHDEDGDRLSDAEMVSLVLTLVLAGHETTAHLIANATVALLAHPDQLDLLRRDPGLWPGAVNELMRWCGPVHLVRLRYAATDVELGGVRIRAGDGVQAVLVSANFDPREYADPDRLDVTRRPSSRGDGHVGFGHGAHYCLGAALARQEGEVALHALFERFPNLSPAIDPVELVWQQVPGARRLAELPVTV
ncbi:cytochrome P450 family protein [Pseudonocardia sp. H11422]|uniref:cytochrome P450 family protein n=1 Tax=Pseudonocardia sp. H11422 TaxID=2835866 RepID=UPI0020277692|nr:cytochrome P450 [Pseudonocardia sp. H11422]